ncbi:MAG: hypothetical protein JWN04_3713 [Myxococcaceae bacterium]|nr:hypothetical protein [Myxococcaceae bacterium]
MRAPRLTGRGDETMLRFMQTASMAAALLGAAALPALAQDAQTVLMVHGYDFGTGTPSAICALGFNDLAYTLRLSPDGRAPHDVRFIGYYTGDGFGCTDSLPTDYPDIAQVGTRDEKLADVARRFADFVHDNYVVKGLHVDIVGHSMGGLIVRAALTFHGDKFVIDGESFVDDVVTGGTPYDTTTQQSADACNQQMQALGSRSFQTQQCLEMMGMDGVAGLKASMREAALPGYATWSLLGSDHDDGVPSASATFPSADVTYEYRKVFARSQNVTHLDYFTNGVLWFQANPSITYARDALTLPK